MAIEKILNTRIQLKYDTLANWESSNPVLKAGEVAVIAIASGNTQTVNSVTAPQCLMKVGDGTSNFKALPYTSALAADVYSWAKKSEAEFITWVNQQVTHPTIPDGFAITVNVTDDDVIVADLKGGKNSVSGSVSHAKKGPAGGATKGATADVSVSGYGATGSIKVPKAVVDEYGHVTGLTEQTLSITMPSEQTLPTVNDGTLTLKASNGLTATQQTFSANDADNVTFEVKHGNKPTSGSAHATTTGSGRTYVTGIDVDAYGHIAGVKVATESDQDLSGYKTKQTAVADKITDAAHVLDSLTQDENGVVSYTVKKLTPANIGAAAASDVKDGTLTLKAGSNSKTFSANSASDITFEIKASDLGLESAMHFVGAVDALPESGNVAGDVVILGGIEYVWDGSDWVELGAEGSHALKTVKIQAGDGLEVTAGGTLAADTTIGVKDASITEAKLASAVTTKLNKEWQPVGNYKTTQSAVADKITDAAHVLTSLTQNANGVISYEVKKLTPADIGAQAAGNYQPAGNYKTIQDEYSNNGSTTKTITAVSQNANGEISVTYGNIAFPAAPTVNNAEITVAPAGGLTLSTGNDGKFTLNQGSAETIGIEIAASGVTTAKIADSAVTTAKINSKAVTTAKIADNAIGAAQLKSVNGYAGSDAEVWVFNCGSASVLVD